MVLKFKRHLEYRIFLDWISEVQTPTIKQYLDQIDALVMEVKESCSHNDIMTISGSEYINEICHCPGSSFE
eukprot:UN17492